MTYYIFDFKLWISFECNFFFVIVRRLNHMRSSERSISTSSVTSEGRGRSNPPLLNEIISMLEEMNYPVNQQLLDKAETIKVSNSKVHCFVNLRKSFFF